MGYLAEYGMAEARREKIVKALVISLAVAVIVGSVSYYFFKNYAAERQVKQFLALLHEQDHAGAYQLWGCSLDEPCQYYPYEAFLEDWGPDSPVGEVEDFHLGRSSEVGSGVIVEIEINGRAQPELWVEKETKVLGFSPYRFRKLGDILQGGEGAP